MARLQRFRASGVRRGTTRSRAWTALLAAVVAVGFAARVQAQGGGTAPAERPVYDFQLSVDLPLMVASAIVGSSWLLRDELSPPSCAPRCDRERLPPFDRGAAGRYDLTARKFSDVGVAAVIIGSSTVLLIDGGAVDFAVGAQAVLATSAIAVLTMMAVRRPRPLLYGDEAPLADRLSGNAGLSFPSGHTANAFAATLALFHSLRLRHPDSPWAWVALCAGGALAGGVGVARVLAGDHFPSDALAGAALGAAIGWAVPELHRIEPSVSISPSAGGLAMTGTF